MSSTETENDDEDLMNDEISTDNKKNIKQRLKDTITKQGKKLGDTITKQGKKWLDADGFYDFIKDTIYGIVLVSVYFYFGTTFNLLAKSAQSNPGGLKGQDLDGPPYVGFYSECKDKTSNVTESISDIDSFLSKWSFPYKNFAKCNGQANKDKPFYFRIITWTTSVIAFAYAMGRKALNLFLSNKNENFNVMLGPILMPLIIIFSPLYTGLMSHIGAIINIPKLLPVSYLTFWFPVLTFIMFIIGYILYPIMLVIGHLISLLYYFLFYVSFSKFTINENGQTKTIRGIISVIKRILSNSLWYISILIIAAISAFTNLGLGFSLPFIGWIGFILVTKYLSFIFE